MPQKSHYKNLKYGRKVAKNSMFIIIGLVLIKAFGGYITNTIALLGDATSSFGDLITNIAIYIGLTLSLRPPSKRFKYGYHRVETLISLLIAVTMIYFGYRIFTGSIERMIHPQETFLASVGISTALISIVVSLFAYFYQNKIAKKINSKALLTSSEDKRNDAIVSSGVLFGVIFNALNIQIVEKVVAIGIAAIVLFTALKAGKDSLLYLLDYWDAPEITEKIRKIINSSRIVTGIKNLRLRHAGTYIFGEAFLEVNPFTDITDLRDEIHRLDKTVERKVPHLGDFVLYIDPPKPQKIIVAIPVRENKGLNSELIEETEAPFYFLFVEIKNRKIIKVYCDHRETFKLNQSAKIGSYLIRKKTNILIMSHIRTLLFYTLRLNNIKMYPHFSNVKDVRQTVKLLLIDIV